MDGRVESLSNVLKMFKLVRMVEGTALCLCFFLFIFFSVSFIRQRGKVIQCLSYVRFLGQFYTYKDILVRGKVLVVTL